MNYKTLLKRIANFIFPSGKFKIDDLCGRHVVIGGSHIYLLSFLIGLASTGIALEDADTSPETTVQDTLENRFALNGSRYANFDSKDTKPFSGSNKMNVPVTFLKKIFLNNLGLNIIIIVGAFSMLAFSMIVIVFNALQVGMLVKGIYNSFGLKLAVILVLPHLVVEVISHILSLYLAYIVLRQIIVPVVVSGEGINLNTRKVWNILVLFSLVIIITFMAALVEIYVTPKLI